MGLSCPPIFNIALSFVSQLIYRTWMLSKDKTVEIRLWEFGWTLHFDRACEGDTGAENSQGSAQGHSGD